MSRIYSNKSAISSRVLQRKTKLKHKSSHQRLASRRTMKTRAASKRGGDPENRDDNKKPPVKSRTSKSVTKSVRPSPKTNLCYVSHRRPRGTIPAGEIFQVSFIGRNLRELTDQELDNLVAKIEEGRLYLINDFVISTNKLDEDGLEFPKDRHAFMVEVQADKIMMVDWQDRNKDDYTKLRHWDNFFRFIEKLETKFGKPVVFRDVDMELQEKAVECHESRGKYDSETGERSGEGGCSDYIYRFIDKYYPNYALTTLA